MSNLDDLFKNWRSRHINDTEWKNNFPMDPISKEPPPEIFKSSFTIDGKFDDKVSDIKILFICRESNVNGKAEKTDNFWMKKVVETMQENKNNGTHNYYVNDDCQLALKEKRVAKRVQTVYYNYLIKICELKKTELSSCAYMNLNKRGGYGRCCFARLEKYIDNYSDLIQNEIEILSPETVVFLGYREGYGKKVLKLIKNVNPNIKCYTVYHPSSPGKEKVLKSKLGEEIKL